ncbi:hypothetical protein ABIF65_006950 [Bradyrhizobium japonicum]|jgi:hypothetical protein|nr:hypothetical protein [Bradyrhizobium japonicum]MCP1775883.1 hypothetical protein [Bradyrhizobium japonicum]MCP1862906.1 hypothetical protein [Bradyrhizobium japonicum]MCP1893760.1 hypothetical protein [Bradyrhizobium japonicum]MCP1961118.1 hypothetical protein [Bradyrhizobium japonicum]
MGRKRVGAVGQGVGGEVVATRRCCHCPRRRAIQYSETVVLESIGRGVLDAPPPVRNCALGGA